jgi:hemerythrin
MAVLEWKDEFLTGVESIDNEHRWLIDMINEFDEKCLANDILSANRLFDDLKDFLNEHSENEENLMSRYEYPGLEAHRNDHKKIALKAAEVEHRFREQGIFSPAEIKGFVIEYFYRHIMVEDRKFGEFVKTAGSD